MMTLCSALVLGLTMYSPSLSSANEVESTVKRTQDSKVVKELVKMIEEDKTVSNPKFKVNASASNSTLSTVLPVDTETKYAELVTDEAGAESDGTVLAATVIRDTNSKSTNYMTVYNKLEWKKDGKYVSLKSVESWWKRTSSSYSIKDGYQYASATGSPKSGGGISEFCSPLGSRCIWQSSRFILRKSETIQEFWKVIKQCNRVEIRCIKGSLLILMGLLTSI